MNRSTQNLIYVGLAILTVTLAGPQALLARDITIVGEINDQNELVASDDGTVYELAGGQIADKLIFKHRGEKIRVVGRLIKPVQEYSVDELPKGLIEVISYEDVPD